MSENASGSDRTQPQEEGRLEKLLNDRVLGRYIAQVGYSTLSKVQECLKYSNQVFRSAGEQVLLPDLLTARVQLVPVYPMRARRGFRA